MEKEESQQNAENIKGVVPHNIIKSWAELASEAKPITIGRIYFVDNDNAEIYVGMEFDESQVDEKVMMEVFENIRKAVDGFGDALFEMLYASRKDLVTIQITPGQKTLVFTFHENFPEIKSQNFLN